MPDLVAEVLSPATRTNDLGPKRNYYLDVGVRELWLVDPAERTLVRVRPATADDTLGAVDTLTSELLIDFALPLSGVLGAS